MSVTFSHSFGEHQHPTYLGRAGGLTYGHLDDHSSSHPHHHAPHHHHPTAASDSLASAVPFILYPSGMDPSAALSLYEGGGGAGGPFRGGGAPHHHHHHSLLPYLSHPFHHAAAAAAAAAAGRFGVYECPFEPAFIQKRNERERQRVKCVNQGYAKLREHLPGVGGGPPGGSDKRLSKVETLRAAIRYINYLQGLIDGAVGAGPGGKGPGAGPKKLQEAGLRVETVGRDGGGGGESPISSALYSSLSSSSSSSSPGGESQSSAGC